MKPKQTQVLGLLITLLLSLIIYDLYIIYSLNLYMKLDQLDVTTSFAIIDAIFFQVIKLIIVSYGIFALSVEIRGIVILRDRLKNKILAKLKQEGLVKDSTNQFTLNDLAKEINIQDESANLTFEPVKTKVTYQDMHLDKYQNIHLDRYGREALDSLTRGAYLNLSVANIQARLESLKKLENWYKNTSPSGVADIYRKYWDNCVVDINFTKTLQ